MDERVARLKTPDECKSFADNAMRLGLPHLAIEAKQRAVELRAGTYGAKSDAERECIAAIFAYEEILSQKKGKRQRAGRTWPMVKKYGALKAAEKAVDRRDGTAAFEALKEAGLERFAFEAVVLRYPGLFSESAVVRSRERMARAG
ncbi:hypothetical protein [Lysobacter sp. HA35]